MGIMKLTKKKEKKKKKKPNYSTIFDKMVAENQSLKGECVISQPWEQVKTINPTCPPGQSEIVFAAFMYRIAKWHFSMAKVDEYVVANPMYAPSHLTLMQHKQSLEQQIKSGLASVAQAVSDYELLKHDERRYREILDFFEQGKKDDHVLRSLFVDRVDAYTGEGYSMISMARRWPTIISDFLKIKDSDTGTGDEDKDIENIMKKLHVSRAEATVLKTKNELYKQWKKSFYPDVKERYIRIKTLLESRKKSIEEYKKWLKPIVDKHRRIREEAEFNPGGQISNPLLFANIPTSGLRARLWIWRPFTPEEMGKPLNIQGEVPIYDDFVKRYVKDIEEKYGVSFGGEDKVKDLIESFTKPGMFREEISGHIFAMDKRYIYYYLLDIDYEVDYLKGSQGPLEVEDQNFHIRPYLISQNVLAVMLLELAAKKMAFERELNELIGLTEEKHKEEVESIYGEKKRDEEKGKVEKPKMKVRFVDTRKLFKPLYKYFFKGGPYETNIKERITKLYGEYAGTQLGDVMKHLKEVCFSLSGVRP